VIPNVDGDDRRLMVLVNDNRQAVFQREFVMWDFEIQELHYDRNRTIANALD
jgi:hypothetical protein